jgi:hypothetical protein
MPCQFEFLEARLALQVGSELKNRENRGSFNHFNENYAESFSSVKHRLLNIPLNCKYLLFLQDFFLSIETKKV